MVERHRERPIVGADASRAVEADAPFGPFARGRLARTSAHTLPLPSLPPSLEPREKMAANVTQQAFVQASVLASVTTDLRISRATGSWTDCFPPS
jgi:hypothetical protein